MNSPEYGSIEAETIFEDAVRSVAVIALTGLNRPLINHGSDMEYEVLCGEGTLEVDFEVIELRPGVRQKVPKGTPYQDEALTPRLILRATATPLFNAETVEYLA